MSDPSKPRSGNQSPPDGPPVFIRPVVAWRTWFLEQHEGRWLLDSVIHRCLWQPRERLTAYCLTTRGERLRKHFAPFERCMCGIYGTSSLKHLANYITQGLSGPPKTQAVGLVSLWGDMVTYEHGWRGSHAYPHRLWLPRETVRRQPIQAWEQIAFDLAGYGVPVEILDDGHPGAILDDLAAWSQANPGVVSEADRCT
jgi:hypothetical protein